MTPIIRRFVMKMLSKDQGSGITKLPNQMQSGFQESIVTETLVKNGYDPRLIKDEAELKMIMNRIRASKQQTKEQKQKANKIKIKTTLATLTLTVNCQLSKSLTLTVLTDC